MTSRKIAAITSITGAQAMAISRSFADGGYEVRGLSRKPGIIDSPFQIVAVDPTNVDALTKALTGVDVVAFTSPIDYRASVRETLAETLILAADRAGVRRIVLNAAAAVFEDFDRPVSTSMRQIREIILSAKVEAIALQPTVYMDNLIEPWAKPSIVNDGVFAYPMHPEARVSWMSHKSLGAFMHAAADMPLERGRIFNIGGPEALTGDDVAAILGSAVGRTVRYHFVPPKDFAKGLNQVFGTPVGDYLGDFYSYVETNPGALGYPPSNFAALGVTPEPFRTWARRQSWAV